MKKIIQICSLLSLVFLFTAVSASAQSPLGTDVEIPFAFNVGDHSYEAGHYILKLNKYATGSATLSIHNTETDEFQTVILNANGDMPGNEIKLVFATVEGVRYLSKIRTTDRTYALAGVKRQTDTAKAKNPAKKSEASIGGGASSF